MNRKLIMPKYSAGYTVDKNIDEVKLEDFDGLVRKIDDELNDIKNM